MLIKLLLYSFGDKKTDQKAQILIPEYGKKLVTKFHTMEKFLILLFSYTYFCSMKLYERV